MTIAKYTLGIKLRIEMYFVRGVFGVYINVLSMKCHVGYEISV